MEGECVESPFGRDTVGTGSAGRTVGLRARISEATRFCSSVDGVEVEGEEDRSEGGRTADVGTGLKSERSSRESSASRTRKSFIV